MPPYLYHATPVGNAQSIATNGLEPRSVGGEDRPYLSMSGIERGATTLGRGASDIIFRVQSAKLNTDLWSQRGAGDNEWRGTEVIAQQFLEYRRNLGNDVQTQWRPANLYPTGLRSAL